MIKILQDRVIFDGHAEDKATCETTTLLANALAKSEDFKQVEYRSGYAEFEKVGKTSELKFAPDISYRIYVNGTSYTLGLGEFEDFTWTAQVRYNSILYTISDDKVLWEDGTILQYDGTDVLPSDTIIENGQYTTRAATPTISFKHFYKTDTLIGTGTYKFRRYSQSEPVVTPRLAAPASVSVSGTIVTFESVTNATSYEFFVDGVSIAEYTP